MFGKLVIWIYDIFNFFSAITLSLTSYLCCLKKPCRVKQSYVFLTRKDHRLCLIQAPCFADEESRAQQRQTTCPRSQKELLAKGRPDPRPSAFLSSAVCADLCFHKIHLPLVGFEPLTQRSKDQACAPSVLDFRLTV